MEEASQDFMDVARQEPGDDKLFVQFRKFAAYDKRASEGYLGADGVLVPGAGRAIYKEVDYIKIAAPGDGRNSVIDRAVTERDKRRFPKQWAAYLAGQDQDISGTPLAVLTQTTPPILNVAQLEELKHLKVRTVEQLADVADGTAPIMGFNGIKAKARAFLDLAKSNAPFERMRTELEVRDATIANMKAQLDALTEAANEARKNPNKK